MMTPEERYLRDPLFHQLVDMIRHELDLAHYTPTEVRETAMLACFHFEMRRHRTSFEAFTRETMAQISQATGIPVDELVKDPPQREP